MVTLSRPVAECQQSTQLPLSPQFCSLSCAACDLVKTDGEMIVWLACCYAIFPLSHIACKLPRSILHSSSLFSTLLQNYLDLTCGFQDTHLPCPLSLLPCSADFLKCNSCSASLHWKGFAIMFPPQYVLVVSNIALKISQWLLSGYTFLAPILT